MKKSQSICNSLEQLKCRVPVPRFCRQESSDVAAIAPRSNQHHVRIERGDTRERHNFNLNPPGHEDEAQSKNRVERFRGLFGDRRVDCNCSPFGPHCTLVQFRMSAMNALAAWRFGPAVDRIRTETAVPFMPAENAWPRAEGGPSPTGIRVPSSLQTNWTVDGSMWACCHAAAIFQERGFMDTGESN